MERKFLLVDGPPELGKSTLIKKSLYEKGDFYISQQRVALVAAWCEKYDLTKSLGKDGGMYLFQYALSQMDNDIIYEMDGKFRENPDFLKEQAQGYGMSVHLHVITSHWMDMVRDHPFVYPDKKAAEETLARQEVYLKNVWDTATYYIPVPGGFNPIDRWVKSA